MANTPGPAEPTQPSAPERPKWAPIPPPAFAPAAETAVPVSPVSPVVADDRVAPPSPVAPDEPTPEPGQDTPPTPEEHFLRRLLGTASLELDATVRKRLLGWVGPLLVTALAAVARFADLGKPHALVFDETYYVKGAYSLYRLGYEAAWPKEPDKAFVAGDVASYLTAPDYVVHPPVGKWLIALGFHLGDAASSTTWRLSTAIIGTLAVLMLARIARRLFASNVLGTIAGGLLAVDGLSIVLSRTSLLDNFLMFFVLAAFGALLLDRDQSRRRLARRAAIALGRTGEIGRLGPRLGVRWWRLLAAVLLGLAVGTKWSGLYFFAFFAVMSVLWDLTARRRIGVERWALGGVRDGAIAAVIMIPVVAGTYLASWTGWFRNPHSWGRDWAQTHPGEGVSWLPSSLRSLWHYHLDMWHFHNTLTTEHTYMSHPLGWIVQWRPTSFFWEAPKPAVSACGWDSCAQAVTSLGNPILWWSATIGLGLVLWWLVRDRDWRALAVLSGVAAGWLPWFAYAHRTIFTFYAIAFTPWVVLVLTYVLGRGLGPADAGPDRRRRGVLWVGIFLAVVVAVSAFFYPVWTAQVVPYRFWQLHMWLPSWI